MMDGPEEIYYPNLDRGGEGFSTFASTKKAAGGGANFDEEAFFSSIKQVLKRPTTKYRETSLGRSLKEAGNELLENKKISETLYNKLLLQFDRSMLGALKSKASAKIGFKAIELMTYKYFDDIWNFTLRDVELRENNSFANVKQLRIIAFEGKASDPRFQCPESLEDKDDDDDDDSDEANDDDNFRMLGNRRSKRMKFQ